MCCNRKGRKKMGCTSCSWDSLSDLKCSNSVRSGIYLKITGLVINTIKTHSYGITLSSGQILAAEILQQSFHDMVQDRSRWEMLGSHLWASHRTKWLAGLKCHGSVSPKGTTGVCTSRLEYNGPLQAGDLKNVLSISWIIQHLLCSNSHTKWLAKVI